MTLDTLICGWRQLEPFQAYASDCGKIFTGAVRATVLDCPYCHHRIVDVTNIAEEDPDGNDVSDRVPTRN